jgi:putative nucleotidyltransferase with HDIG domain
MNDSGNLHHMLQHLHALPPIPRVAQGILSLKLMSERDEQALLKLIEKDPSISARVIGLANSPLFGTSKKIMSVSDATALLGIRRVKMTALSFAMLSSMARAPAGLLNVHSLWRHSLTVTMAMQTMSRYMPANLRPQEDEIFLAGLLHDIGFLVLDYLDPMLSNRFHAMLAAETGRSIEEVESGVLEMSHSELGAEVARHWELPENIVAVLRYHHQPDDAQAAAGQPLVRMVNVAEKLLPTFGTLGQAQPEIAAEEWQSLGIDPRNAAAIIEASQRHAREIAASFA